MSRGYIYYCHNASSLRSSLQSPKGTNVTRQPYWKGVHISLVICVFPTHITSDICMELHKSRGCIYHCDKANSVGSSLQSNRVSVGLKIHI